MSSEGTSSAGERSPQSRKAQATSAAKELRETTSGQVSQERAEELQERWDRRLVWPVLGAAVISVPAVFLTLLDEPWEMIGHIGLWITSAVLVVEVVVLFLVSPKKVDWLKRNWWLVGLTALVILGVVFSFGPMQILRLVRSVGALRVLRAKQVARAGESLQSKGSSPWLPLLGKVLATVVVAAFVIIALIDPESEFRTFLEDLVGEEFAIAAAVAAGLLTMGAMYLIVRSPKDKDDDEGDDGDGDADGESDGADGSATGTSATEPRADP